MQDKLSSPKTYKGSARTNKADNPIHRLLGVGTHIGEPHNQRRQHCGRCECAQHGRPEEKLQEVPVVVTMDASA